MLKDKDNSYLLFLTELLLHRDLLFSQSLVRLRSHIFHFLSCTLRQDSASLLLMCLGKWM